MGRRSIWGIEVETECPSWKDDNSHATTKSIRMLASQSGVWVSQKGVRWGFVCLARIQECTYNLTKITRLLNN